MSLAIDVKRPRKEFDFVPKEIECHRAGQVGQVFKFDFAERHRLLRKIKNDAAVDIRRGLAEEDNLEVRDVQFRMVDDDDRSDSSEASMQQVLYQSFPRSFYALNAISL